MLLWCYWSWANYLMHSLSHSFISQNASKTKAKEMKENEIYWFMFTKGLIQVLLLVICWLNSYCSCISKPYFQQPGNVYLMCNITVYVYCAYICVILLCLHTKPRGPGAAVAFPNDETKFIFIVAATDLCCFTAVGAVDMQTPHGCICESMRNTISLFLLLV